LAKWKYRSMHRRLRDRFCRSETGASPAAAGAPAMPIFLVKNT
jgi:hypothetical protein